MSKSRVRIASWNVNGLRAVGREHLLPWMDHVEADIICLQEIKASPDQLDGHDLMNRNSWKMAWAAAQKPGYSGVMAMSKHPFEASQVGIGIASIDQEGRWLEIEFENFILVTAYFPNSQRDHARLGYKLKFCDAAQSRLDKLKKKGKAILVCGDFNIAHKEIDLKNPKSNKNNAGFLPEERAWMDQFIESGWTDAFRMFESGPDHYTWWSYRPGVRQKNVGWRIDYFFVDDEHRSCVSRCVHQPKVMGSDHCPVVIDLSF